MNKIIATHIFNDQFQQKWLLLFLSLLYCALYAAATAKQAEPGRKQ